MTDMLRLVFAILIFVTLHFCSKETPAADYAEAETCCGREER